jgi:hypothetical protein
MQGKTRLAIFCAFLWVITWSILYFVVDGFVTTGKIKGFLLIGILPAVLFLFGWWVKLGFKSSTHESEGPPSITPP